MNGQIVIGTRENWGTQVPLLLSTDDRRHHVYVVGKSGTGKTTLLRNMILQDIEAGRGVGIIDPHGDLATDLLDHIPSWRVDDVEYFDPADFDHPVAFNPLAGVPPEKRHLAISGFIASIKGIWPEFFGPRMEDAFNAALAALLECENVSLLGLLRMLSDEEYRAWVLRQVKDPLVRFYWRRFDFKDVRTQAEIVAPIENKLNQFILTPHLRHILGQVRSRMDARFIMDNGRIFIANLSKGKIGEDQANLLGALWVTQFQIAAMSRADTPEAKRRDFHLYVDEFQSFVSESFASLLSEARKYRLNLTLAHQYLDQIKPNILDAVFGNVGSLIAFRIGHTDAEAMEKAFGSSHVAAQFTGLDNGEIIARMLSNGKDDGPFFGRTHPPYGTRYGKGDSIIKHSRTKYSRPREIMEGKVRRWLDEPLD